MIEVGEVYMKTHRRLNKAGKIALLSLIIFIFFIILSIKLISYKGKKEIHILKSGKYYQLKINYPLLHDKKIDKKIKEYVDEKKQEFLDIVDQIEHLETDNKYDFIIQYQLNKEDDIYHIHLETYSYTGGEHYQKDDKTFHYDIKRKEFITIEEYLNDESSLEKLSLLSYYYIMEYGEENGKEFNEEIVKEYTSSKNENFIHFNIQEDGFEFLFALYQETDWIDGEIKIIIPYKELNELLKPKYQKQANKKDIEVIVPETRDLEQYKGKKLIAFTFDDGPSTETTNLLLDGVKEFDAKVTFFVIGNRINQHSEVLKRAYKEGHVIGSHTYNHRNLLLLNDYTRLQEIKNTNDIIENTIGVKPILLRPPYGNINDDIKKLSNMHIIEWDIDTLDWKYKDKDKIANEIITNAHDGAIVLLHDIYKSLVEGALQAMAQLKEEGYVFVTILEMAELKGITLDYETSYFYFK